MAYQNGTGYQDVNALLRSLTAYLPESHSPQPQAQVTGHQVFNEAQSPISYQYQPPATDPKSSYEPVNSYADYSHSHEHSYQNPSSVQPQSDYGRPSSTRPQSATPVNQNAIDPRTIIDWPIALRYVTKLTVQHDKVLQQLRRMIANQHDNERTWWKGRQALQKQQKERVDGKRALDDVFRSIGVEASKALPSVDDETELKIYDSKIHKAQMRMEGSMIEELKGLGIPFFGTRSSLIVDTSAGSDDKSKIADENPKRIDRDELMMLQKRMLTFLEELCGD